jgi:hypothetical protein
MSGKEQVQKQAQTPAAAGPAYAGQSPVAVPEYEADRPDIVTQLEGAARLGHSLDAIRVKSAAPWQTQSKPLIQVDEELTHTPETTRHQGAILPEVAGPEAMVQRMGTYEPVEIEQGQPTAIAELEYAEADKIKFTVITSCIGLIGCKGKDLMAVHLPLLDKNDKPISDAKSPDLEDAVRARLNGCDPVFLIGETEFWPAPTLDRIKAAAGGITPDHILSRGSGVYEALWRGDEVVIWHDADQVWPEVGSMLPEWPPGVGQELPDEEEELQTKPAKSMQQQGRGKGFRLDNETAGRINRTRGAGQPLDGAVQVQMSETMGHDLSGVRVHTDSEADLLNQQLSAKAFTTGQDIFFRQGEYNPASGGGRELLAHELSHVVQQSTGRVSGWGSGVTVLPAGDTFEQEADRVANAVTTAADTPAQLQLPKEDKVRGVAVLQRQDALEEQLEIEGRDFQALLKAQFDEDVHDIIDEAWGNIAEGIRYMRAGQRGEGEFFFDLAAGKLAALMPQPDQVRPEGLALWSGEGAGDYARGQGYTVLEDTEVGRVLDFLRLGAILPEWPLLRPLWDAISRQYASLPRSGQVHIFAAARANIVQILQSRPEEMPVLISTELNALANKNTLLQRAGDGVTEVWHILGADQNNNLRGVNIDGEFDDAATFDSLADAAKAMQMYYVVHAPERIP